MTAAPPSRLLVEDRDLVRILSVSNPARRNALSPSILAALRKELVRASGDGMRCVVLRGEGEVAFSSGYDLGSFDKDHERPPDAEVELSAQAIEKAGPPVIAFLNGLAFGGGFELACACDLRIAAEGARFCMPPAKLGLVYGPEGIARFAQLIGPSRARRLFFTGEVIDALTALSWGLLDELLPVEQALARVLSLAEAIAANAPSAVCEMKRIFVRLGRPGLTEQESAQFAQARREAYDSEDAREGRAAFLGKRKPRFTGR